MTRIRSRTRERLSLAILAFAIATSIVAVAQPAEAVTATTTVSATRVKLATCGHDGTIRATVNIQTTASVPAWYGTYQVAVLRWQGGRWSVVHKSYWEPAFSMGREGHVYKTFNEPADPGYYRVFFRSAVSPNRYFDQAPWYVSKWVEAEQYDSQGTFREYDGYCRLI